MITTHCCELCHVDGLLQEGRNSSELAIVLRLSCSYPSIWSTEDCVMKSTETAKEKRLILQCAMRQISLFTYIHISPFISR